MKFLYTYKKIFIFVILALIIIFLVSWLIPPERASSALSGVIALATIVYAFFTYNLARETELLRKAQTNPLISLSFGYNAHFLTIEIHNVGQGPAYEICFHIKDNIEVSNGKHLTDLNIFRDINYMTPGKRIAYEIALYEELKGKSFGLEVRYKNKHDEIFNEEFNMNIGELEGMLLSADPIENRLAGIEDNIGSIEGILRSVTTFGKGKKVLQQSLSVDLAENQEQKHSEKKK